MTDSDGVLPVTERDWEIAFSAPASAVNRFTAFMTPMGVRVSFLEIGQEGSEPQHRTSVVMAWADAIALSNLLQGLIEGEIKKMANDQADENAHVGLGNG